MRQPTVITTVNDLHDFILEQLIIFGVEDVKVNISSDEWKDVTEGDKDILNAVFQQRIQKLLDVSQELHTALANEIGV